MAFFVWTFFSEDPSAIKITDEPLELEEDAYLLHDGVPVAEWFPDSIVFTLSADGGSRLVDAIPNTLNLLLISEKLKAVLVASHGEFEFFPIEVHSPNGVPLKQPYFLANLLTTCACADLKRSEYDMNPLVKNQVRRFYRLVLEAGKIPLRQDIFRLMERTRLILIRADLRDRLESEGVQGPVFRDLDEFGSEFRP